MIEPSLRSSITKTRIVKIMWDELLYRFRVEDGPRYYELKAAIMSCKHKGTSLAAYYAKLKNLWDEIANYKKGFVCD